MPGLAHLAIRCCACVVTMAVVMLGLGAQPAAARGARIAFARGGDLYSVRPDGSRLRTVTSSERHERSPAWSADHATIAFVSGARTLRVVDARGSGDRRVFALPRRYDAIGHLAWSPNSGSLAFTSERATRDGGAIRICSQVWVVSVSGGRAHRILSGRLSATGLTWSPDGRSLAASFEQASSTLPCRAGQDPGIYRLRTDGSHLRDLGAPFGTDPDWSPDGRHIVFRDWRRTCHACGQIWVMRSDGSRQRLLADAPRRHLGAYAPAWSPSGEQVSFLAQRSGRFSLWVMDRDGGGVVRIRRHADDADW